ncbi:MAG: CBS domain-containing protein, partial [Synechocystis sp.]
MTPPVHPLLARLDAAIDRSPLLLSVEMPLKQAIAAIYNAHTACGLVVAADQTLVGIITERDIVRLTIENQNLDTLTVQDVMSHPVVSVAETDWTEEASPLAVLQRFNQQSVPYLPIVNDQGRVTGLITQNSLGPVLTIALELQQWVTRYQLAERASSQILYEYNFAQNS